MYYKLEIRTGIVLVTSGATFTLFNSPDQGVHAYALMDASLIEHFLQFSSVLQAQIIEAAVLCVGELQEECRRRREYAHGERGEGEEDVPEAEHVRLGHAELLVLVRVQPRQVDPPEEGGRDKVSNGSRGRTG